MRTLTIFALALVLCGCAGGPTHDYYSPRVVGGKKYKGPLTTELFEPDKLNAEKDKLVNEGYTLIGSTDYVGKYPEAAELKAQAKRVAANHVVYSCDRIPAAPGSWKVNFGSWGGHGGSASDEFKVKILFLGK